MNIIIYWISADCKGAGTGQLKAQGSYNGKPVDVKVTPDGKGSYHLSFLPIGRGKHVVRVHYNDAEVKGNVHISVCCTVSDHIERR